MLYYLKNDNVVECHTADELLEDYYHNAEGHLYGPDGARKHSVLMPLVGRQWQRDAGQPVCQQCM